MDMFKKYCKYNIGSNCQLGYKECPMLCNYFEDCRDYNIACEYMVINDGNCECLKYCRNNSQNHTLFPYNRAPQIHSYPSCDYYQETTQMCG